MIPTRLFLSNPKFAPKPTYPPAASFAFAFPKELKNSRSAGVVTRMFGPTPATMNGLKLSEIVFSKIL